MTEQTFTYELSIAFVGENDSQRLNIKDQVRNWLIGMGEESFVDGMVDNLDIDFDYSETKDYFEQLGGETGPISIYRFDLEYLDDLQTKAERAFGDHIQCHRSKLETQSWREGWKESFRPISSDRFFVYPPWHNQPAPIGKIPIEIEPGMAFGTGQHATTQLCMELIEQLPSFDPSNQLLDVGAGTGILSIALAKLGNKKITATDIDPDAVKACQENAIRNKAHMDIELGSVPEALKSTCRLVVANILFVVIRRILPELKAALLTSDKEHPSYLITSGVLTEESNELRALAAQHGLELIQTIDRDGWNASLFKTSGAK